MKFFLIILPMLLMTAPGLAQDSLNISLIAVLNNCDKHPSDVAVFDNHSVLAVDRRGIFRFDISDINNPAIIDSVPYGWNFDINLRTVEKLDKHWFFYGVTRSEASDIE